MLSAVGLLVLLTCFGTALGDCYEGGKDKVYSSGGYYYLDFQSNGNVVVRPGSKSSEYGPYNWAVGNAGQTSVNLCIQDGALTAKDGSTTFWELAGKGITDLQVTNSGVLQMLAGSSVVWSCEDDIDCWSTTCEYGTCGCDSDSLCVANPIPDPTPIPTPMPTHQPTPMPTHQPTPMPTAAPTFKPTPQPTSRPTGRPSMIPSSQPSSQPTNPTGQPSSLPSMQPSVQPSSQPSVQPTNPTSAPTSMPSGQPSSEPSGAPTSWDILEKDVFLIHWDWRFVLVRIRYYLGSYVAYFICWFFLLLFMDKTKVAKMVNALLLQSAFESQVFLMSNRSKAMLSHKCLVVRRIAVRDAELDVKKENQDTFDLVPPSGEDYDDGKHASAGDDNILYNNLVCDYFRSTWKRFKLFFRTKTYDKSLVFPLNIKSLPTRHYLPIFYEYMLDQRYMLGCSNSQLIPNGVCGVPKELVQDWLLYVLNNHDVVACIFAAKGSPFTREARRFCYLLQTAVGFSISALLDNAIIAIDCVTEVEGGCMGISLDTSSHKVLSMGILSPYVAYLIPLIKIFVVTPFTIYLSIAFRSLYNCNLHTNKGLRAKYPALASALRHLGKISAIVMVMGALFFLTWAAILTPPGTSKWGIITYYFFGVQLPSFIKQLVEAAMAMIQRYHLSVHICGITIIDIGHRYCECIARMNLAEGVDFSLHQYTICRDWLFHIDYIFPYRQLTDTTSRQSELLYSASSRQQFAYDVNPLHRLYSVARIVGKSESTTGGADDSFMESNPMHCKRASVAGRSSSVGVEAGFELQAMSSKERESQTSFITSNPLHSSKSKKRSLAAPDEDMDFIHSNPLLGLSLSSQYTARQTMRRESSTRSVRFSDAGNDASADDDVSAGAISDQPIEINRYAPDDYNGAGVMTVQQAEEATEEDSMGEGYQIELRKLKRQTRVSFVRKFKFWETRDIGLHTESAAEAFDYDTFKQIHGIVDDEEG